MLRLKIEAKAQDTEGLLDILREIKRLVSEEFTSAPLTMDITILRAENGDWFTFEISEETPSKRS